MGELRKNKDVWIMEDRQHGVHGEHFIDGNKDIHMRRSKKQKRLAGRNAENMMINFIVSLNPTPILLMT